MKVLEQIVWKDLVPRRRLGIPDLGVKYRDPVKGTRAVRNAAGDVLGQIDTAVGRHEQERLHQESGERVPVGVWIVGACQARGRSLAVAEERVHEALGEDGAGIRTELKTVRIDEAWLRAGGHQHVQIIEVADHDPGRVEAGHGGVNFAEEPDDVAVSNTGAPEDRFAIPNEGLRWGDDRHRVSDDGAARAIGGKLLGSDHLPGESRRKRAQLALVEGDALLRRLLFDGQALVVGVVRGLEKLEGASTPEIEDVRFSALAERSRGIELDTLAAKVGVHI